jgi:hypothetical protein
VEEKRFQDALAAYKPEHQEEIDAEGREKRDDTMARSLSAAGGGKKRKSKKSKSKKRKSRKRKSKTRRRRK